MVAGRPLHVSVPPRCRKRLRRVLQFVFIARRQSLVFGTLRVPPTLVRGREGKGPFILISRRFRPLVGQMGRQIVYVIPRSLARNDDDDDVGSSSSEKWKLWRGRSQEEGRGGNARWPRRKRQRSRTRAQRRSSCFVYLSAGSSHTLAYHAVLNRRAGTRAFSKYYRAIFLSCAGWYSLILVEFSSDVQYIFIYIYIYYFRTRGCSFLSSFREEKKKKKREREKLK